MSTGPPCLLADLDGDFQGFGARVVTHSAHRRGAERIQSDGDAHMRIGRAKAAGGIEGNPTEAGDERFRPGVTGLVHSLIVVTAIIAADISRRNAEAVSRADEDVAQVARWA